MKKSREGLKVAAVLAILILAIFVLDGTTKNSNVDNAVSETADINASGTETSEKEADIPKETTDEVSEDSYNDYKKIAYVTVPASENWRWIGTDGPEDDDAVSEVDTDYVTHINFAFGMLEAYQFEPDTLGCPLKEGEVASQEAYKNPEDGQYHYRATVQGWIEEMGALVDGREYLRALVALKEEKEDLNILLSIGGWDSDGFCYMAKTPEGRAEFIESCIQLVKDYRLDGIDLDWEFPTNGGWGAIASCGTCVEDGNILLQEMRSAMDQAFSEEYKLLTIASGAYQPWVDDETFAILDYINVMCYDYDPGTGGEQAGLAYADMGMQMHIDMVGDTPQNRRKLNLGLPFYNEGGPHLVPYHKEWDGYVDASPEIIKEKMEWVKDKGYGGAFYWAYSMDVFEQDTEDINSDEIKILQRTLYENLTAS